MPTLIVRKINMELVRQAQAVEDADPKSAQLMRDASDEIDRLRSRLNDATDHMIRSAHEQAERADRLRTDIFPRVRA